MKFKEIQIRLKDYYQNGTHKEIYKSKVGIHDSNNWKSEYLPWINEFNKFQSIINGYKIGGFTFRGSTLGQNVCLTATGFKSTKQGNILVVDYFYIQKSLLFNAVTFYITRRLNFFYESGELKPLGIIICSPFDDNMKVYNESWELLKSIYPDLFYLSFGALERENNIVDNESGNLPNYYTLIFGGGGNIFNPHLYQITGYKYFKLM